MSNISDKEIFNGLLHDLINGNGDVRYNEINESLCLYIDNYSFKFRVDEEREIDEFTYLSVFEIKIYLNDNDLLSVSKIYPEDDIYELVDKIYNLMIEDHQRKTLNHLNDFVNRYRL